MNNVPAQQPTLQPQTVIVDMSDVVKRLEAIEKAQNEHLTRTAETIEKHSLVLERVADRFSLALDFMEKQTVLQRESLPVTLVLRMFRFFAIMTVGLTSFALGIKWLAEKAF